MNMLVDIDWAYMRATFLVVVALLLVPPLTVAGEKFNGYLLRKFDERKARKIR
jgi:hypothetical protein